MKKKWIAIGLSTTLLLSGCGSAKIKSEALSSGGSENSSSSLSGTVSGGDAAPSDIRGSEGFTDDSLIYSEKAESLDMSSKPMEPGVPAGSDGSVSYEPGDSDICIEESYVVSDSAISTGESEVIITEPFERPVIQPQAGLLTAGEWCDNKNWGFYTNLITADRFNFNVFGLMPYERVAVQVTSSGIPAKRVLVDLFDGYGQTITTAVTNQDGIAYLYYNLSSAGNDPSEVAVRGESGLTRIPLSNAQTSIVPVTHTDNQGQYQNEIDGYPSYQYNMNSAATQIVNHELTVEIADYVMPPQELDLMFLFDTTGSMGDELIYLQTEFMDIVNKITGQSSRYSVNFYRDQGDDYIVRSYPFTTSAQEMLLALNQEFASGGGDYEEAVDLALLDAVRNHTWNEKSVKLLFIVLDAPPHNTQEVCSNLAAVAKEAAAQGIRIIPIASSGVDSDCEALLRILAMTTGGTYTFLTNHSGIGGDHLEPTIGNYEVEALNNLIVRLILEYTR